MRFLFVLLLLLSLAAPLPLAHAAPPKAKAVKEQLAGTWLELAKSDNLFIIKADGSYRLLLKKGEIENLHFLAGTWSLDADSKLTLKVKVGSEVITSEAKVSFEGEELILTNESGPTKHRRVKGPVPERFEWK